MARDVEVFEYAGSQSRKIKRPPTVLTAAFAASILVALSGPLGAEAKKCSNNWAAPSTPAVLPPSERPFQGKINRYLAGSVPAWPEPPIAPKGAPNVVIILIDDAGFAATDLFGGPIRTPELDQFAAQGLRYNDFNVTAICSPTRAALLSGRNPHRVGFGFLPDASSGYPGYDGIWKKSTASIAEVLLDNGYSTAAFGKWHNTPVSETSPVGPFDHWPTGLGFQYFYGFIGGMDSEFEPRLYENTTSIYPPKTPAHGYYFTTDITDHAITWLLTHEALAPSRPYFIYFAPSATHQPQQVQHEWIKHYRGHFTEGWDQLRQEIFERQKTLGVIPENAELTARPREMPAWDSLSPAQKRLAVRQMEVYAGFMAETDHQIGRLLRVISSQPDASNTLIFYIVGDNGAAGEGGLEGSDEMTASYLLRDETLEEQLRHIDRLGGPDFDNLYAAGWAWALDTPFKWMKQIASNFGGTRDPLIVVWPSCIKDRGGLRTQFIDVDDVVPTVYQVAGINAPTKVDGIDQLPLDGTSFAYTFDNPHAVPRHHVQYFETLGSRAIYENGWVASARHGLPWPTSEWSNTDYAHDRWRLFHVAIDFSEAHDLAQRYPEKLVALKKVFDAEARENGVYPLGGALQSVLDARSLVKGLHKFVFYRGMPPTPCDALPIFSGQFRYDIRADLVIPASDVSGVLVSDGSRLGGFVLYVKNGTLVYDNNMGGVHTVITSSQKLPSGKVKVKFEYIPSGGSKLETFVIGTGTLYVNGSPVGTRKLTGKFETMACPYGSFIIGRSYDSSVSRAYRGRFPFTGTIKEVVITAQVAANSPSS